MVEPNRYVPNPTGALEREPHIILVEPAGRSGVTQLVHSLANALVEMGRSVTVVTAESYELEDYPRKFQIERIFRAYRTNLVALFFLFRRLTRRQPCVVDFHGATHPELYLLLLWMIRWGTRARLVYTVHDPAPRHRRWFPAWILKWMYAIPDHIQTLASGTMETVHSRYKVPRDKISLVPLWNYLFIVDDLPQPAPQTENHVPLAPMDPTILFFGFITPNKGLMDLIDAFALVRETLPTARLSIVGPPGESFDKYRREIQRLELDNAVVLHLEYVSCARLVAQVKNCDVVAVPYRSASQSGVIQVAYALEKPVVATNCEGVAEAVVNGKSGVVVPVGDPAAMSRALIELLQDEERRRAMGAYGRKLAETQFSVSRAAREATCVYRSVVDGRRL
jgi:glycosyltransferase involved in cell wall biosynthesis